MNVRDKPGLTFDDVLLVPKLGKIKSRKEVTTHTYLTTNKTMEIPIVSAPMSSVTNTKVAKVMDKVGGAAFLHRNQTWREQLAEWKEVDAYTVGCAIGITERYEERMKHLWLGGCPLFCIDIAHAHSWYATDFLNSIPPNVISESDVIIGSIATAEAVEWFVERYPVAGFRVGIGPGAACTTREKTGHGVPQLTAISECVEAAKGIPVIADGGINTSGDIVKALAAGASSVMLGRLIAACEESPQPGMYYGMASKRAKLETGARHDFTEGAEGEVEIEGPLEVIIENLMHGIKSGISYSGGHTISTLQDNHEFIICSHGAERENKVRI